MDKVKKNVHNRKDTTSLKELWLNVFEIEKETKGVLHDTITKLRSKDKVLPLSIIYF